MRVSRHGHGSLGGREDTHAVLIPHVYAFVPGSQFSLVAGELQGEGPNTEAHARELVDEATERGTAVGSSHRTSGGWVVMVAVPVGGMEQQSKRHGLGVVFGVVYGRARDAQMMRFAYSALGSCIRTVAVLAMADGTSATHAAEALTAQLQAGNWAGRGTLRAVLAAWTLSGEDLLPHRRSSAVRPGRTVRVGVGRSTKRTDPALLLAHVAMAGSLQRSAAVRSVDLGGMPPAAIRELLGDRGWYRTAGDAVVYETSKPPEQSASPKRRWRAR